MSFTTWLFGDPDEELRQENAELTRQLGKALSRIRVLEDSLQLSWNNQAVKELQGQLAVAKQSATYYKTRSQDLADKHKIRDRRAAEIIKRVDELLRTIEELKAELSEARRETQGAIKRSFRARELEKKLEEATERASREHEKRVELEISLLLDRNQIADLEQLLRDTESSSPELLEKLSRLRQKNKQLRSERDRLIDALVELGGDSVLVDGP